MLFPMGNMAMTPSLMGVDGVVGNPSGMKGKPGVNTLPVVRWCVIISEIVMTIPGPVKQEIIKDIQADDETGRKDEIRSKEKIRRKIHRCEQYPSPGNNMVPVPAHIEITTGGPYIMGWNPNPLRMSHGPISRPPGITVVTPLPESGNPYIVGGRRIAAGADFHGFRRLRQVLGFLLFQAEPVS
jgi:hypothetical protein